MGGIDLPGVKATWDQDFDKFYDKLHASLMDGPTRGYAVVRSDNPTYAALKDMADHPLFASVGNGAYYKTDAQG